LQAAGAGIEHVIKMNLLVVEGQPLEPGFAEFQRVWGDRPNPPLVTMAYVSALARPEFLVELEAIAVVPL
jgi:enamine deaminase RidA (YjgF/YER057c/UK114 family)